MAAFSGNRKQPISQKLTINFFTGRTAVSPKKLIFGCSVQHNNGRKVLQSTPQALYTSVVVLGPPARCNFHRNVDFSQEYECHCGGCSRKKFIFIKVNKRRTSDYSWLLEHTPRGIVCQRSLGLNCLIKLSKIMIFVFVTFSVMGHIFDAHKKLENFEGPIFIPPTTIGTIGYPTKKTAWKKMKFS